MAKNYTNLDSTSLILLWITLILGTLCQNWPQVNIFRISFCLFLLKTFFVVFHILSLFFVFFTIILFQLLFFILLTLSFHQCLPIIFWGLLSIKSYLTFLPPLLSFAFCQPFFTHPHSTIDPWYFSFYPCKQSLKPLSHQVLVLSQSAEHQQANS